MHGALPNSKSTIHFFQRRCHWALLELRALWGPFLSLLESIGAAQQKCSQALYLPSPYRSFHVAYARVSQQNYSLSGLVGCELKAKTVGVIGTGGIGSAACQILKVGGGCCTLCSTCNPASKACDMVFLCTRTLSGRQSAVACPPYQASAAGKMGLSPASVPAAELWFLEFASRLAGPQQASKARCHLCGIPCRAPRAGHKASSPRHVGTLLTPSQCCTQGFGCQVLAYDLFPSQACQEMGVLYIDTLEDLLPQCEVVTLHCPLLPATKHMMNASR